MKRYTHPALRLIGIADAEKPGAAPVDAAREHDLAIVDGEETSWTPPAPSRTGRSPMKSAKKRHVR
jgi:hypothetical protein